MSLPDIYVAVGYVFATSSIVFNIFELIVCRDGRDSRGDLPPSEIISFLIVFLSIIFTLILVIGISKRHAEMCCLRLYMIFTSLSIIFGLISFYMQWDKMKYYDRELGLTRREKMSLMKIPVLLLGNSVLAVIFIIITYLLYKKMKDNTARNEIRQKSNESRLNEIML